KAWSEAVNRHQREQDARRAASGSKSDDMSVEVLDASPAMIRRPLCLIEGIANAAAWLHVQTTVAKQLNHETGEVTIFDPPQVRSEPALVVVRGDGEVYSDTDSFPGSLPLARLGLSIALPSAPPPDRCWSGAGVKRFIAGECPRPADVFRRVTSVADRFLDFG